MSDLHRAVQAEIAAHTPALPPSFDALKARKRSRDRRRNAAAVAVSALAVVAVAAVPAAFGSGAGNGSGTTAAGQDQRADGAPEFEDEAPTGATICALGASAPCREVGADVAQRLGAALDTAKPAPDDAVYCAASGPAYMVRFEHRITPMPTVTVRVICGPMTIGDRDFLLDASAAESVKEAYEQASDDAPEALSEEVRRGCASFTEAVHNAESNEVYDPQTGVLQVYVGSERYALSLDVQECRDNPVAMERLKMSLPPSTEYAVRHVVYTHCGVLSTTINGVLWLAEPPLPGPPSGWDENETLGDFRLTDSTHALFTADTGVEATFTKAEPGARDPAAECE